MFFGVESTDVKIVLGNDRAFSTLVSDVSMKGWVFDGIYVTIDLI